MSQPVGITAKIQIAEDNFKKYVRNVAGDIMAQNIFEILTARDSRDFNVFKYIKKENALYAFFYFHYGNGQFLLEHPLLAMLQQIEPYLDQNSRGYLVANCDSLNFAPDDFVYAANIQSGRLTAHEFTEKECGAFWQDADKHFFKNVETGYTLAFPKVVITSVVKKVEALQEAHRVQMLKSTLHTATLEKPIEIFPKYFYNGQHFYTFNGKDVVIFDNINLQELRQTPYGVCDDKHAIAGHICLTTNPAKFKKHHKNDQTYFSSAEAVYNYNLEPYPNSDGLSFRMLSENVSEDKNHIYFVNLQLKKEDIGEYKINETGYFYKNLILYSNKQVRVGAIVFEEVDAPSFEILSPHAREFRKENGLIEKGLYYECFMIHCRDKNGEFVFRSYDIHKQDVCVERIASLQEYLPKAKAILQEMYVQQNKYHYPEYKKNDEAGYYAKMNEWLNEDFEEKYKNWQYNDSFLRALNNYFYSCFQLYQRTKDKQYLEAAAQLFPKVAGDCFLNPYIFHNTACIFAAQGNADEAIRSISGALYYGYDQIELIWKDEDLQILSNHPQFVTLKNYYEQIKPFYPLLTLPLLEKVETITNDYYKKNATDSILGRFILPSTEAFNEEVLLTEEQRTYAKTFLPKLTDFVNSGLQQGGLYYKRNYERLKDSALLNGYTHFVALKYFFADAHSEYTRSEVAACIPIADKIKTYIAKHAKEEQAKQMIQDIKASGINRIFNTFLNAGL